MPTSYEDLTGGLGRAVNYRAERFIVGSLLARQEVKLFINDEGYALHDISMNGVSFFAPFDEMKWSQDKTLKVVVAIQDKNTVAIPREEVYCGKARIARAQSTTRGTRVGLELTEGFLNLPQIQWDCEKRILQQDLDEGPQAIMEKVPESYRRAVEQAIFFIRFYEQSLTDHEKRHTKMGAGLDAIEELSLRALEKLREPWFQIAGQAGEAALPFFNNRAVKHAARKYTETVFTPLIMDIPVCHRIFHKPLGYPGDYQTMLHLYRNGLEGPSVFTRVFHKLTCEEPLAAGVRGRKNLLKQWHQEEYHSFVDRSPENEMFRVTSLGSGPAQEVAEFLDVPQGWKRPVHWTLIDQEEEALSLAYNRLYPKLAADDIPGMLSCMYMSFIQFIRRPGSTLSQEKQHFIYAAGLVDYLRAASARVLVRSLYDNLAPGGLLTIGNALWPNPHFWGMEFAVDWPLIYRTKEEMFHLAGKIDDARSLEVMEEPAGGYYFLKIRKP